MTAISTVKTSNGPKSTLWCGAYTSVSGGAATGIGRIDLLCESLQLAVAAEIESPSFIALHPSLPVLYAVSESAGFVHAFMIAPSGQLEVLGRGWPTGKDPCHVAVDPRGMSLVTSSWGDGSVDVYGLDAHGAIVGRSRVPVAVDHGAGLPRQSRAHCALFIEDYWAVTTDLGLDLLRVWRLSANGWILDHEVVFPPGSGPRHVARHPSGRLLVVAEFTSEIFSLARVNGSFAIQNSMLSTSRERNTDMAAAHVAINDEGTRAYVSIRQSNSVSTFAIEPEDGELTLLAETPCGGEWPRHHALHLGSLLVANERSGSVAVLLLDAEGIPLPAQAWLPAPSPTCLVVG